MDHSGAHDPNPPMHALLDLERLDEGTFRATPPSSAGKRQFGGLTAGLAVRAAALTRIPGHEEGSGAAFTVQQAYGTYLAPVNASSPVTYEATVLRAGRSSATVRVDATQDEHLAFSLIATLSVPRPTRLAYQQPIAPMPLPDTIPAPEEQYADAPAVLNWMRWYQGRKPIELRFPEAPVRARVEKHGATAAHQRVWMRPDRPLPEGNSWRAGAIAYLSDAMLLPTGLAPHGLHMHAEGVRYGTLNHTMWFHEDADPHDWLLYDMRAEWTGHDRALCTGAMYTREGVRVASFSQEGMLALTS